MGTEKGAIIFKLEYLRSTGWGAISNFITKFSENKKIELLDVEVVFSAHKAESCQRRFFGYQKARKDI